MACSTARKHSRRAARARHSSHPTPAAAAAAEGNAGPGVSGRVPCASPCRSRPPWPQGAPPWLHTPSHTLPPKHPAVAASAPVLWPL
eukprot:9295852-Alexandrium_andersonii.AAC.1